MVLIYQNYAYPIDDMTVDTLALLNLVGTELLVGTGICIFTAMCCAPCHQEPQEERSSQPNPRNMGKDNIRHLWSNSTDELVDSDVEDGCVVCYERKARSTAMPCGHRNVCDKCQPRMNEKCPICRSVVTHTLYSPYGSTDEVLSRAMENHYCLQ